MSRRKYPSGMTGTDKAAQKAHDVNFVVEGFLERAQTIERFLPAKYRAQITNIVTAITSLGAATKLEEIRTARRWRAQAAKSSKVIADSPKPLRTRLK